MQAQPDPENLENLKTHFTHLRLHTKDAELLKNLDPQSRVSILGFYAAPKHEIEFELSHRGGVTICDIFDEEGNCLSTGMAICSPLDNFNKKIGRDISLGRALKELRK